MGLLPHISDPGTPLIDELLNDPGQKKVGLSSLTGHPVGEGLARREGDGSGAIATLDRTDPDPLACLDALRGSYTSSFAYMVQDGEEDGPLDGELEASSLQELPEDVPAAGELPEPLEDQGRADVPDGDGRQSALGVLGDQQDRSARRAPEASSASSWPLFWS